MPTINRLHEAALDVYSADGASASVRAITKAAGLTEGALYRHYTSREDLLSAVFIKLVEPMIAEKEMLVAMRAPLQDRVREWVRCTYSCFDRDPKGFSFVFLSGHRLPRQHAPLAHRQSELFRQLLEQGQREGTVRVMDLDMAAALFAGVLLSVPRMILDGTLRGPAQPHVNEIERAVWLMLRAEPVS